MDNVISFENIYKEYKLGVINHGTLYRDLQSWYAKIRGKNDPNSIIGLDNLNSKHSILALDNINLEIQRGEILGIIGHNGAGKSTLLKVLSRITSPSQGVIKVKGRVSSLLEVGTGFHSELTGRENIYLNGAINGLSINEVSKKIDEIINFSEIDKFIDTPVKRYSTGMFVRLGFAVAAHLDPDILVVDEVLAVGDAAFREKAINKMHEVGKKDQRTVIFVSHNMQSIKDLCTRAVLFENGKIIFNSKVQDTVNEYMRRSIASIDSNKALNTKYRSGIGNLKFTNISFEDKKGNPLQQIISGEELVIAFKYECNTFIDKSSFLFDVRFRDLSGIEIAAMSSNEMGIKFKDFKKKGSIKIIFDKLMIRGGRYIIDIHSSIRANKRIKLDNIMNAAILDIKPGNYYKAVTFESTESIMLLDCEITN